MVAPCRFLTLFPALDADAELAEYASEIRRLGKRAIEDIVAIGQRLIAAKALCGHGRLASMA